MHTTTINQRREVILQFILVLGLLISATVGTAFAQEKKAGSDKDVDGMYRVEVKDGKVFVDGEMVKELKDKTKGVYFSSGEDEGESNAFVFFSDDDGVHSRKMRHKMPHGKVWTMDSDSDSPLEYMFHSGNGNMALYGDYDPEDLVITNDWTGPMRERVEKMQGMMGQYRMFSESSREMGKLEREARELARSARNAEEEDRSEIESDLNDLLGQIFDMKLEQKKERVDKMSKELEKLHSMISERSASRDDIIQRRFDQLLGRRDVMDW